MSDIKTLSTTEKEQIDKRIDRFFTFVQDVLDDPSTLERLPDDDPIELIPIEQKRPGERYLAETRHFAVSTSDGSGQNDDSTAMNSA